jgi:hypothetical protein
VSLRSPPSVLVLDGPASEKHNDACLELITGTRRPTDVLTVCDGMAVDERAARLRARSDTVASTAFVTLDAGTAPSTLDETAVRRISTPGDLTGIGLGVVDWLTAPVSEGDLAVCIDDVSTMVEYTDLERVFRLLHALEGTCRDHGARFHVHVTGSAHDDRAVATLRQLFDEQRDVSAGGQSVRAEAGSVPAGVDPVDGSGD